MATQLGESEGAGVTKNLTTKKNLTVDEMRELASMVIAGESITFPNGVTIDKRIPLTGGYQWTYQWTPNQWTYQWTPNHATPVSGWWCQICHQWATFGHVCPTYRYTGINTTGAMGVSDNVTRWSADK